MILTGQADAWQEGSANSAGEQGGDRDRRRNRGDLPGAATGKLAIRREETPCVTTNWNRTSPDPHELVLPVKLAEPSRHDRMARIARSRNQAHAES
jgi:hypothetical protein